MSARFRAIGLLTTVGLLRCVLCPMQGRQMDVSYDDEEERRGGNAATYRDEAEDFAMSYS
jgi:hypothetical protein